MDNKQNSAGSDLLGNQTIGNGYQWEVLNKDLVAYKDVNSRGLEFLFGLRRKSVNSFSNLPEKLVSVYQKPVESGDFVVVSTVSDNRNDVRIFDITNDQVGDPNADPTVLFKKVLEMADDSGMYRDNSAYGNYGMITEFADDIHDKFKERTGASDGVEPKTASKVNEAVNTIPKMTAKEARQANLYAGTMGNISAIEQAKQLYAKGSEAVSENTGGKGLFNMAKSFFGNLGMRVAKKIGAGVNTATTGGHARVGFGPADVLSSGAKAKQEKDSNLKTGFDQQMKATKMLGDFSAKSLDVGVQLTGMKNQKDIAEMNANASMFKSVVGTQPLNVKTGTTDTIEKFTNGGVQAFGKNNKSPIPDSNKLNAQEPLKPTADINTVNKQPDYVANTDDNLNKYHEKNFNQKKAKQTGITKYKQSYENTFTVPNVQKQTALQSAVSDYNKLPTKPTIIGKDIQVGLNVPSNRKKSKIAGSAKYNVANTIQPYSSPYSNPTNYNTKFN
jgi:hypothetical protein